MTQATSVRSSSGLLMRRVCVCHRRSRDTSKYPRGPERTRRIQEEAIDEGQHSDRTWLGLPVLADAVAVAHQITHCALPEVPEVDQGAIEACKENSITRSPENAVSTH